MYFFSYEYIARKGQWSVNDTMVGIFEKLMQKYLCEMEKQI